jgi:hypothetical protein
MRRREFITGLGAAATPVLWPVAGRAQQPAKSVIGYLHVGTLETTRDVVAAGTAWFV